MPNDFLLGLLFKTAHSLLSMFAKEGVQALLKQSPVAKAIDDTCKNFPEIDALQFSLTAWCESTTFRQILQEIKDGNRDIALEDVVASFIGAGFHAGEKTQELAEQVLCAFAAKLEEQIYGSDQGLHFHAHREEVLHAKTCEVIGTLREGFLGLEQKVLGRLPPAQDRDHIGSEGETAQHAKIDTARDLLRQGRARAARSILETLQKEIASQSPSIGLQYRIATNLGACALELDETEIAIKEFTSALTYEPKSVKALANAGLAKLIQGRPQDALLLSGQARQIDSHDSHATSVYIRALHVANRNSELEDLLRSEPSILDDPSCSLILGNIRCEQGKYEEAETFAKKSLRSGSTDPQTYMILSQAIITPIQTALHDDPPFTWRLPDKLRLRLLEAETALTCAVDHYLHYDNKSGLHNALVNRAAIRGMLGNDEDALTDCNRVLGDEPSHGTALHNKAMLLMKAGRSAEVIQELERIPHDFDIQLILASAYEENKDPDKAIAILLPLLQGGLHKEQQLVIADTLLAAYAATRNEQAADKVVHLISDTRQNDPQLLAVIAHYKRKQGKPKEAVALLREALAYGSGNVRDQIALDLADVHYSLGQYSEAVELYDQVVDKTSNNSATRKYLVALFNTGSYREALLLAQSLRGTRDAVPVVTEVEALIMEHIGDLDQAIDLFNKLSQVERRNAVHQVRIALLRLRQGNREIANEILSRVDLRDIQDSKTLIQVAHTRSILCMPGVLQPAYQARRLEFGNPEVHLAYVGFFLNREIHDQALLDVNEVTADCTVHLRTGDHVLIFTIVDDPMPNRERGELALSDPLAKKLLGLRKGSNVVLRTGGLEELSYEISEVQSKYVSAFQETLSKFTTWFPDHAGLMQVKVEKEDLSKIFLAVDARSRQANEVLTIYRSNCLPLGAFARLVGSSLADVWAGLVGRPDGVFLASTGGTDDAKIEVKLVNASRHIVLDFTSLLTLAHIGILDRLPLRFDSLIVSQALVDEIDSTIASRSLHPLPSMTIWKEGERYLRREITPADIERSRDFYQRIRTHIKDKCSITPTTIALDLGKTRFEQLEDVLGKSAVAALLIAKERGLPLFSDDLGLRIIAKKDWGVSGFWTQTLLVDFREKGVISNDQYHEAITKLLQSNYRFVSLDADGLIWILRSTGFTTSPAASRAFEALHGPDCTEESAVFVLSDLVKRFWLEPLLYQQKLLLLDLVLNALTTGRDSVRILQRFKIALRERFALVPLALRPIFQSIDLWAQQKILRGGLFRPT